MLKLLSGYLPPTWRKGAISSTGIIASQRRSKMTKARGLERNPYAERVMSNLSAEGPHANLRYFDMKKLNDERLLRLPYSIRVLLESQLRNCDGFSIKESDVETVLDWASSSKQQREIPFMPARVLLQDFTGVPAVVDLAVMRDAAVELGGKAAWINPIVPVDLVIDHSVQVDFSRTPDAFKKNLEIEMSRNKERFAFLKWGSRAFSNLTIVPPGSGIVHQVNLEYLARVVFQDSKGIVYPDSLVGTDSHTTMVDGLGVVGWGVGGIEAEAVMLGQPVSMVLPEVVGVRLLGHLPSYATATDLVLTVTKMLREEKVVGKFVEFFGGGCDNLTLADRATVANMAPEYGATMGFFPVDGATIEYLKKTGRGEAHTALVENYCKQNLFFRDSRSGEEEEEELTFSKTLTLDLSSIEPCVAGPKRPQDRVAVADVKEDFARCLRDPVGFKGYGRGGHDEAKAKEGEEADKEVHKFTLNGSGRSADSPDSHRDRVRVRMRK
eukprot:GHVU01221606.1.p1 GENE.GHVU01221606.1~~GHVU01221606.1.p1  ORF type:complete len:496 (-),score=93.79 GHVU01221606.1:144-1631(-)